MIGKVTRGRRVGGLLTYLFGPGEANEHVDPRLVAAWAPIETLALARTDGGGHDLQALRAAMEAPGLLVEGLLDAPKHVWHCSMRAAPGDRVLSDAEWAWAAEEVMHRTGLARRGDDDGVRWVAVRHADDHVHLAAVLARQDGRRAQPRNDYRRVVEAARAIEARFELTIATPADRTSPRPTTRAELESAARAGREPSRVVLRRTVTAVLGRAGSPEEFLAGLREAGLLVRERHSQQDGAVTGFAVAVPGDRNGDGRPVFYGGSKLAADLSWRRVCDRWPMASAQPTQIAQVTQPPQSRAALSGASGPGETRVLLAAIDAAARRVRADAARHARADGGESSDVPEMTAALLAAIAHRQEGRRRGPLTAAADAFDRSQREPWGRRGRRSREGEVLAEAGRAMRRLSPRGQSLPQLVAAIMLLVAEVQHLREIQQRHAQAAAAAAACDHLAAASHPTTTSNVAQVPTALLPMTSAPPSPYRAQPRGPSR